MIPGIDSIGRLAIGQLGQNYAVASGNLTQASGGGVANSLTGSPGGQLQIAAGTGVAHGITQDTATKTLPQAVCTGAAGGLTSSPSQSVTIAAGTGTVGTLIPLTVQAMPLQAYGTGAVGNLMTQSTAPTVPAAVSVGVAGSISSAISVSFAAIGAGIAGIITALLSGGSGSRYKPGYGLEPLKKRQAPPAPPRPKVVLPPSLGIVAPPIAPRETTPVDDIQYAHHDLRSLEARIMEAKRATERQRQDEADIADVMAMLELTD